MVTQKHLPKFYETFIPILKTLAQNGHMQINDLRRTVSEKYYADVMPEELALKTKNGDPLLHNRIGWGKAYLKQANLVIQPERGKVEITEKGRRVLAKGSLSLKDLQSDPDYLKYQVAKDTTTKNESTLNPQERIENGIQEIEQQVKSDLLDKLKHVDPFYFEKIVLLLLSKMGYGEFVETSKTGDFGIDGVLNQDKLGLDKIYMQAKRFADNSVREKDIRNFIGAMSGDTEKGIFVTTSQFDKAAVVKARDARHKIILIDGNELVDLMYLYSIGMQETVHYKILEIDEDFFEA